MNNPKMINGWQGAVVANLETIGGDATGTARLRRRHDAMFGVVGLCMRQPVPAPRSLGPTWDSRQSEFWGRSS